MSVTTPDRPSSDTPAPPGRLRLPTAARLLEEGRAAGLHRGAQLFVARGGVPVTDLAIGESSPGVAMRPDTLQLWMSSTKPVTAVAIGQQLERGFLQLDDPIAEYLPGFEAHGKEGFTVRHLLTHTAGFRASPFLFPKDDWETIIAKICAMRPERNWEPGEKAGYHQHTSWYILAELVRILDGGRRSYSDYVREEIFLPLGMTDCWIGMPEDRWRQYRAEGRLGTMSRSEKGVLAEVPEYTDPAWLGGCRPGGNGFGPARQLARLFACLLAGGQWETGPLLTQETAHDLTRVHREGMFDQTFRHVMDWGLGLICDAKRHGGDPAEIPYGFGAHASARTFGHGGMQSSIIFADPQWDLVVSVICNGMPGEDGHRHRMHPILSAIYEDLGLDRPRPQ